MQGLAKDILAAAAAIAAGTASAADLPTKIVRPRLLGPVSTRQWRPLVRSVSYGRGRQTPDRHCSQRRTRR